MFLFRRIILCAFSLFTFGYPHLSQAQFDGAEQSKKDREIEQFKKLQEIQDPELRIDAELKFLYLGTENPDGKRIQNFADIQSRAESSPDEMWIANFVFSRGLNIDELAQVIDSYAFDPILELDVIFVKPDGRLATVGFHAFDLWSGTSQEILEHLIAETRHNTLARRSNGDRISELELLIAEVFADADSVRFYKIKGKTSARTAQLLLSSNSDSIVYIEMGKHPFDGLKGLSEKLPIPLNYGEPGTRKILRGGSFQESSSNFDLKDLFSSKALDFLTALSIDFLQFVVPNVHAAVSIACGTTGNICPPDHTWVPQTQNHWATWSPQSFGPHQSGGIGYLTMTLKFDSFTDPSSAVPVELWAYKDSNQPLCLPRSFGTNAPCENPVFVAQQDVVYVSGDVGFEHQVDMVDHGCFIGIRSGTFTDFQNGCMYPFVHSTDLPSTNYLGSTLFDDNDVLSLEVGTQDAHLLSAGTTYVSVVNWMGLTFNSIHAGDEATQIVQISSVRDTSLPPG